MTISIPAYTFSAGQQVTLTATYTPDAAGALHYSGSTANITIQVTLPIPAVAVTFVPNPATVLQQISTFVTVAARTADPVPTGSINLTIGCYNGYSYASTPTPLVNGSATIIIPAGSIPGNSDYNCADPRVNYTPDNASSTLYAPASDIAPLTVNLLTPTVTVTPASNTVASTDPLTVTVTVDGGSGNPTPAGTINLFGGGYNGNATLNNGSASFTIPAGTLTTGIDTLQAGYQPALQGPSPGIYIYYSVYSAAVTVGVTVGSKLPPTIVISTGGSFNFTSTQPIPITASVSGLSSMPIPTGTVVLSSGSYTSAAVSLNNGAVAINIPALTLPLGSDTITVTYKPDTSGSSNYAPASNSIGVNISGLNTNTALSLSADTITTAQPLTLTATVSGQSGYATPTGSVTLSNQFAGTSSYTATLPLNSGSVTFTIPAGSLEAGQYSWLANYVPDANSASLYYQSFSPRADGSVTAPPAAISLAGVNVSIQPGAASGNTSAITVTPSNGFTGSVALTAELIGTPPGFNATYLPTFSFGSTTPCAITSTTACTATMTVTTTAATSGALAYPRLPWYAAGGPALAGVLLLLLPRRRRRWLAFFALLTVITLAGGLSSCGGGSSGGSGGGGGGGGGIAGTTAGTYTVTVTGTSGGLSAQTTVTVTVL